MHNRKILQPVQLQPKIKISFVLPRALSADMHERIVADGYGLKAKSRWVVEAVEALLAMQTFPELVRLNDEMAGFEKLESILVTHELKSRLNEAVISIRKIYLTLEGIQSRILRTAIMQRLLT